MTCPRRKKVDRIIKTIQDALVEWGTDGKGVAVAQIKTGRAEPSVVRLTEEGKLYIDGGYLDTSKLLEPFDHVQVKDYLAGLFQRKLRTIERADSRKKEEELDQFLHALNLEKTK